MHGLIESDQGAVDGQAKIRIVATQHQGIRLVREVLAADPKLLGVLGLLQESDQDGAIRGEGVGPTLLDGRKALSDVA